MNAYPTLSAQAPRFPHPAQLERPQAGVGCALHRLPVVDSTNRYLADLAAGSSPAQTRTGTVVLADTQTAGRGKYDRVWASLPESSLTFSVLLRPARPVEDLAQTTLVMAVAVAEAVAASAGLEVEIKWPNDLMVRGRKLCGILCELVLTDEGEPAHIIAGVGLNLNHAQGDFPPALQGLATSIALETGRKVDRFDLLTEILERLEERLSDWEASGFEPIRKAWSARSCTLGREIVITQPGGDRLCGTAITLEANGNLTLREASGRLHSIVCGEISSPPDSPTHGALPRTAPAKEENESK
ncbi:biotin--[acetyl-CoA-carboxylase] ligase [Rhodobacter maris]|uniref:BirA family biotin operon repressor/biotin-[acetyl-CoA-carboxylase] ligase n=1 Tax=Rhodobacter maris TaxID=446682 RepID=A0A285TBN4_9RHOB|nr:biotin--[acetyl-CoA-carboxylase] ligase [Rhodobacter maris]SOC19063.1 BirA family biotin operon repressor/biotin-[acetyl-CoA-carboxylase] ligase [Rhodobacter maris]